jgi:hypothetical protein
MELFTEAVILLEEQSAGVKRLPRVDQALSHATKLQQAEAEFADLTGRCYSQMGNVQGSADLKQALNTVATADTPASQEAMQRQLRRRCEQIYGDKASSAITAARELLGQEDSVGAEAIVRETMPWLELAPAQAQEELRALEAEAAAAKKVIRFRRGSWR